MNGWNEKNKQILEEPILLTFCVSHIRVVFTYKTNTVYVNFLRFVVL